MTREFLRIKTRAPICVYSTDIYTGRTQFFAPDEEEFAELVNENFLRKYLAYTGILPESGVDLVPVVITERDKFVTKYKNVYVSGWNGIYELYGEPKYLDFLYQTGLGSKNSQGFGMFDII